MVLKTREKIMIGVAVLVGVVMGFDQFFTTPKKKEVAALQKQVQESNEKMASVTASLTGLNPIKKRVGEKRKEKEALSGRIPDDRQISLIMDQLGKESQTKQIDLVQLNINEESAKGASEGQGKTGAGSYKRVILDVGLSAGFNSIGSCLENIQSLPIFMEIEKVDVRRQEESFPKLKVSFQQFLFVSSVRKGPTAKGDAENVKPGQQ
jgi:Tfp pilus assembly protein PilO